MLVLYVMFGVFNGIFSTSKCIALLLIPSILIVNDAEVVSAKIDFISDDASPIVIVRIESGNAFGGNVIEMP